MAAIYLVVLIAVSAVVIVTARTGTDPVQATAVSTPPETGCREKVMTAVERIVPVGQQINDEFDGAVADLASGDLQAAADHISTIRDLRSGQSPFVKAINDTKDTCISVTGCEQFIDLRDDWSEYNTVKWNLVSELDSVVSSKMSRIEMGHEPTPTDLAARWFTAHQGWTETTDKMLRSAQTC